MKIKVKRNFEYGLQLVIVDGKEETVIDATVSGGCELQEGLISNFKRVVRELEEYKQDLAYVSTGNKQPYKNNKVKAALIDYTDFLFNGYEPSVTSKRLVDNYLKEQEEQK